VRKIKSRQLGRKDGYPDGSNDGYFLGRCQAVIQSAPPQNGQAWDIKVLYVTSGKGYPYSPIDEAIISAFQSKVKELVVAQPNEELVRNAEVHSPDLIFVLDGMFVKPEQLIQLKQLGIHTALWLADDPYYTDITALFVLHYHHVFTLELSCVSFYQELGCPRVNYLPFAANPTIYKPQYSPSHLRKDIRFIGSAYWNRVAVFDQIASFLANHNTSISGIWWDRLKNYSLLGKQIDLGKWMSPEETASSYSSSKIVINLHRDSNDESYNNNSLHVGAISPNPRTFEISACAALQLTDIREDISRFYTLGHEIVTYASPQELVEKLEYFLINEEERKQIAINGMKRTLAEHTYEQRLEQALEYIYE
jgi:spore maturation protein CgeB